MSITSVPGPIERRANHRIAIRWRDGEAKVCQLQFGDDGFFVHFPYHPDSQGVASRCVLPPQQTQTTVNLAASGYVTSHKVKYSHHVDGNCHFSQDGKVVTTVRNLARPLTSTAGHVFTLHVQGLGTYPGPKARDDVEVSTWVRHPRLEAFGSLADGCSTLSRPTSGTLSDWLTHLIS